MDRAVALGVRVYALVGIVPLLLSIFVDGGPQVWIPLVVTSAVIESLGLWVLRRDFGAPEPVRLTLVNPAVSLQEAFTPDRGAVTR